LLVVAPALTTLLGTACRDVTAPAIALRRTYVLATLDGRALPTVLAQTDSTQIEMTVDSLRFSPSDSSVVHTYSYTRRAPGLYATGRVTSPADHYHAAPNGTIRIDDYGFGFPAAGRIIGDRLEVVEQATGHTFEYQAR
jgi:hypothetical protein